MRKLFGVLAAFIAFLVSMPAPAQICTPPVITDNGIGDGCTTSYATSTGGNILLPSVGIFKSTFTPACNAHDKCYTTLGTTYNECDSNFLSSMRGACSSTYPPLLLPDVYAICVSTAELYYGGVKAYQATNNPLPGLQEDALRASYTMGQNVHGDYCGTTPAMTLLYDPSLINQVNSTYQQYAHRLPTIYEFLDAVNINYGTVNDVVQNPTVWNAALIQQAIAGASAPPPMAAFTSSKVYLTLTFNATQSSTIGRYQWNINNQVSSGPSNTIQLELPAYTQTDTFKGFLKVVGVNGVPNMALVSTSITLNGECNVKPGGPCR